MSDFKPFCCDMSEATIGDIRCLYRMCKDAGAFDTEEVGVWIEIWSNNRPIIAYMGVDKDNDIISYGHTSCFDDNLIPFDQVSEYLGLPTTNTTVTSTPTKWTKAMQKEGIPLSVGMLALLNVRSHFNEKEVLVLGTGTKLVLFEVEGSEDCLPKEFVMPFPNEETLEQKEQRKYFINEAKATMTTLDAEELYEDVKHLFKY